MAGDSNIPAWKSGKGLFSGYFRNGPLIPGHIEAGLMTIITVGIFAGFGWNYSQSTPWHSVDLRHQFPPLDSFIF